MLPPDESRRALLRLFRKHPVVTLDTLFKTLRTRSRMSVFRRLSPLGYLTSYSHAGRYYTLRDIPAFGEDGLWHQQGVAFSQLGSLKNTVKHLVNDSEDGRSHHELELTVRVRVHNTLLDLVEEKSISRIELPRYFLYVSPKRQKAKAQIARRQQASEGLAVGEERPPPAVTIEVLLEIIHGTRVKTDPAAIAERLGARGLGVRAAQVEAILERHGLKKTPPSPSRRSRR